MLLSCIIKTYSWKCDK